MKSLTPAQYAKEVWGGAVTDKTVRNWIKRGKKLKGVSYVETTPTNHYVLFMEEEVKSNVTELLEQMRAKAA
ncbi:MAG: hypothetical protein AAF364_09300 [Pseudomonadota bacterium]